MISCKWTFTYTNYACPYITINLQHIELHNYKIISEELYQGGYFLACSKFPTL